MKSDLSADQHRVAATGSTAFAMENAALRAENERLRAAAMSAPKGYFDDPDPFEALAEARAENERLRAALRGIRAAYESGLPIDIEPVLAALSEPSS